MKRWLPFIALIILAIFSTVFVITGGESDYLPESDDPGIIYQEVCVGCHGTGKSAGNIWSPDLAGEIVTESDVKKIVREGTWRMPAFPSIPDSILDSLAVYVAKKRFAGE
jgi:mono/diheme cytochrome c family protein